jgi:hypothetical protein
VCEQEQVGAAVKLQKKMRLSNFSLSSIANPGVVGSQLGCVGSGIR